MAIMVCVCDTSLFFRTWHTRSEWTAWLGRQSTRGASSGDLYWFSTASSRTSSLTRCRTWWTCSTTWSARNDSPRRRRSLSSWTLSASSTAFIESVTVLPAGMYFPVLCKLCAVAFTLVCIEGSRYYRVVQNKPVYLFLSSVFCISTTKHASMIMYEYLSAHFFSVFLFFFALQVLKALFYANFYKLSWKFE